MVWSYYYFGVSVYFIFIDAALFKTAFEDGQKANAALGKPAEAKVDEEEKEKEEENKPKEDGDPQEGKDDGETDG